VVININLQLPFFLNVFIFYLKVGDFMTELLAEMLILNKIKWSNISNNRKDEVLKLLKRYVDMNKLTEAQLNKIIK